MIEGYKTVHEIAEKWKLKPRTIQIMCSEGRIVRATKVGNLWLIPADVEKPPDERVKTGKYKKEV